MLRNWVSRTLKFVTLIPLSQTDKLRHKLSRVVCIPDVLAVFLLITTVSKKISRQREHNNAWSFTPCIKDIEGEMKFPTTLER